MPASAKSPAHKKRRKKRDRTLSRTHKPDDMSLEQWQIALRHDFAKTQRFKVENVGRQPIFSEFHVTNPQTHRTYRVAIRGARPGDNYCSCPDYAVNTLGTCKHVEYVLQRLSRRREDRQTLAQGYHPPYSELYLRYGSQRHVIFHRGLDSPPQFDAIIRQFTDANGTLRPERFCDLQELLESAKRADHELRLYDDALAYIAARGNPRTEGGKGRRVQSMAANA